MAGMYVIVFVGQVRAPETGVHVGVVDVVGWGEAVVRAARAAALRRNSLFMVVFFIRLKRHAMKRWKCFEIQQVSEPGITR